MLATDERNMHFESKRPHVVAALNQAGRLVSLAALPVFLSVMIAGNCLWLP